MIARIMKIWKNLFSSNDKIDSSVIALGNRKTLKEGLRKYVIEEGQSINSTGNHYYEKYGDGTAKAWGTRIVRGVDIVVQLGPFYRYGDGIYFNNMINFNQNTVVVKAFIDNRSTGINLTTMTIGADLVDYNLIRVMAFITSPRQNVDIYINYEITGIPI